MESVDSTPIKNKAKNLNLNMYTLLQVAIGEGKTALTCLGGQCDATFPMTVLQKALKANLFSKWLSRIQIAELEKADIKGLEQCPFCAFATIMDDTPPEQNKLFVCQNPECGKNSCRLCKEVSHIPLSCKEAKEDTDETRKRIFIENKMSEAMIRKCWKCSKPLIKSTGKSIINSSGPRNDFDGDDWTIS